MSEIVPDISKEFVCIIDRSKPELAAVISSYLSRSGEYLPIFEFPNVTIGKTEVDDDHIDEHIITRLRSDEFNVFVANSIGRNGGCNYLVLAGLSEDQKSYLTFLKRNNVIEINSVEEVEFSLGAFGLTQDTYILCRKDEILLGLYKAVHERSKLKIDDLAGDLNPINDKKDGIVIIEKINAVSTVIAVNYGLSINAEIRVINPLAPKEDKEINYLIREWKKGNDARYHELSDKVHQRIEGIYFPNYEFATFFTMGLPYSLIIHDVTPCTYVHLLFRPDLFIFNNLFFERNKHNNAAVVFSPQFWKDEETKFVSNVLHGGSWYVRELIGEEASVYDIDMNVKEFPFDLLHLCSHGGEVGGYSMTVSFQDSAGKNHTVEFDEVVSIAPHDDLKRAVNSDDTLIPVHIKNIWRIFDGLDWGSKELKEMAIPHYVFADMQVELNKLYSTKDHEQSRKPIEIVPDSCAINCSYSVYQAMINQIAGFHTSPIIFNNTCWSWSGIASSFLLTGARGYIGTLWNVNSRLATTVAELFYNDIFNGTILTGLQSAIEKTRGTKDEGVYIYWGLHFASIKKGESVEKSREHVCLSLLRSFHAWTDRAKVVTTESTRLNCQELADWNSRQLYRYFAADYLRLRFQKKQR